MYDMEHIFNMPSGPSAPPPPPPVVTTAEKAKTAVASRTKEQEAAKKRKGKQSTIVTGPLGLTEEPELERKTLLGH